MKELSEAPLTLFGMSVLPEWIDYNGHMADGYYLVAFTQATEAALDALGLGPGYLDRTGRTIFTVEGHINYLREVTPGTSLAFITQVLDHDEKRIHVFHTMTDCATGDLVATNELMFVHVNRSTGSVEPMPPEPLARLGSLARAHSALPRPANAGRSVGIRRATPRSA